jgi:hypothetical protein
LPSSQGFAEALGEGEYGWAEPVGGKVMKYHRPITLALSAALVVAAVPTTTNIGRGCAASGTSAHSSDDADRRQPHHGLFPSVLMGLSL